MLCIPKWVFTLMFLGDCALIAIIILWRHLEHQWQNPAGSIVAKSCGLVS